MNTIISSAAIIATMNLTRQNDNKINETAEKKKTLTNLLLKGNYDSMEINHNEKIIIVRTFRKDVRDWRSILESDEICTGENFAECFDNTLSKIKPKAISVIPYSVDKYNTVDAYILMLKVPDENAIATEKLQQESLNKIAEDMSENIKTAWD